MIADALFGVIVADFIVVTSRLARVMASLSP
jgi:hypothetical protein